MKRDQMIKLSGKNHFLRLLQILAPVFVLTAIAIGGTLYASVRITPTATLPGAHYTISSPLDEDGIVFTSASFDMNGGNTVALIVTTKGGHTSAIRRATFAGQEMEQFSVINQAQMSLIFYIINPEVTSGEFVFVLDPNYDGTIFGYAYSAIALANVGRIADTASNMSTSSSTGADFPVSYTTSSAGSFVLGAFANNGNVSSRRPLFYSGNANQTLLPSTVADYNGHLHTYGTVEAPGFHTDIYRGQYARNALAAVAFDTTDWLAPLTWAAGSGVWDINTTANWNDGTGIVKYREVLSAGGPVIFEDTLSGASPIIVALAENVFPTTVLFTNDLKEFSLVSNGFGIGGDGTFTKEGTGVLEVSTPNTYSGTTTVDEGTLRLGASEVIPDGEDAGDLVVNGIFDLNGFSETINGLSGTGLIENSNEDESILTIGLNDATSTFSGLISGEGNGSIALRKEGSGTLTLYPDNTYTGGTTVAEGTIYVRKGTALGSGTITFEGGTIQSHGDWDIIPAPMFVDEGQTGTILMGNRTEIDGELTGSGTLYINAPSTIDRNYWDAPSGSFEGTLVLSGRNLEARYNGGDFNGFDGTTLDLHEGTIKFRLYTTNYDVKIGALSGSESAILGGSTYGDSAHFVVGAKNLDTEFAGTIRDVSEGRPTSFTKVGTGILALSGTSTIAGPTTVTEGKLIVDGEFKSEDVPTLTVQAGAKLGGAGSITNTVVLSEGDAEIDLIDDTPATLTLYSGLTLADGNILSFDVGLESDTIDIASGELSRTGIVTVKINELESMKQQRYTLISGADLENIAGFRLQGLDSGNAASLMVSDEGDLVLDIKSTTIIIIR